jgi:uncharacterized protein YjgD (DUF1641 family)
MANPIAFVPKSVDPKHELQRRLDAAPMEHAEALLVAYDLLEEAHRQGILDALHGLVGAKDTIAGLLAKYAAEPVSVNAIRNLMALGKILGAIDPEPISQLSKEMASAMQQHKLERTPPSLWQLMKRATSPEARRGLSFMTLLLGAFGRSLADYPERH